MTQNVKERYYRKTKVGTVDFLLVYSMSREVNSDLNDRILIRPFYNDISRV
jgi:hypothetical protein